MKLPRLDVPIYEIKLISTGKTIRYRPFLVKEQKLFLMASESNDQVDTLKTIRQVLRNCILDDVDVDNLPTFELEWIFLHLRAKSVEEIVQLKYKCNNKLANEEGIEVQCKGVVEFDLNLMEIEPTKNPTHTNKIKITENLGICMKYPTIELVEKYENMTKEKVMLEVLVDCIDYIYDKDNIYYSKDNTKEELQEFIDNLQQKDLEKIKTFFETVPEIKKLLHFKCPKCGYEEDIVVKGLQNFFV
jgi:hypothetical protein